MDKGILLINLLTFKEDLEKNKLSTDQINNIIDNTLNLKSLMNMYLHKDVFSDEDIDIIKLIVIVLQLIYNNLSVDISISDDLYDRFYELYRDNSMEEIVGAAIISEEKSFHKYTTLRGTLDKIHYIEDLEKPKNDTRKSFENWIRTCQSKINSLNKKLYVHNEDIILMPKYDGLSVVFECDKEGHIINALTRGDVQKNEASIITSLFLKVKFDLKLDDDYGIKTEIVMDENDFNDFTKKFGEFKNKRSAVASILSTKITNPELLKYLTIIPLEVVYRNKIYYVSNDDLYEHALTDVKDFLYKHMVIHSKASDLKDIKYCISSIKNKMKEDGIPIDGVVIRFINSDIRDILGRENDINKFEVAYKFPAPQCYTKLIDVDFSTGSLGNITPIARVKPVVLEGNTISNISLGSIDRFKSLNLRKNSKVLIKYNIIPYLDIDETCDLGNGEIIETPVYCQYCNSILVNEPTLKCVNESCESRLIGKLENYIEKMRIMNISSAIIRTLYNHDILKNIQDLYNLKNYKTKMLSIDGFGEKLFKKIIDSIDSRKNVYDHELLGCIGIPEVSNKTFKKILTYYNLGEVLDYAKQKNNKVFEKIEGIKEKKSKKIIKGINKNIDLIKFLMLELNVYPEKNDIKETILFTKVRDKKFEEFLKNKGYEIIDSYNKKVDYVITESVNTKSKKIEKALNDGKIILGIDDAYLLFKYN